MLAATLSRIRAGTVDRKDGRKLAPQIPLVIRDLVLGRLTKNRHAAKIVGVAPDELEQALLDFLSRSYASQGELAVDEPFQQRQLIEVEQALVEALQIEGTVENGARELVRAVLLIRETEPTQELEEVAPERPVASFFVFDPRQQRLDEVVDRSTRFGCCSSRLA